MKKISEVEKERLKIEALFSDERMERERWFSDACREGRISPFASNKERWALYKKEMKEKQNEKNNSSRKRRTTQKSQNESSKGRKNNKRNSRRKNATISKRKIKT